MTRCPHAAPVAPVLFVAAAALAAAACAVEPTVTAPALVGAPSRMVASAPESEGYLPGHSYFGRNNYIEYIAGDAPVIFTASHGGTLTPSEIATRACGTNTLDLNTQELVRTMQASFYSATGRYPHVVINRLRRSKLDANRDSIEATCGDPVAMIAWQEWHHFIEIAKEAVLSSEGKGWYMDMHGHGHDIQRLELGYLVSDARLNLPDATLDGNPIYEDASSIRTMSRDDESVSFSALLRGPTSLGTLYANEGFPSIPSSHDPSPNGDPYFDGGYNTRRYGCRDGGTLCGVQIESNLTGVRDNAESRARFADATVRVLDFYLATHWGIRLTPPPPPRIDLEARERRVNGRGDDRAVARVAATATPGYRGRVP